MTITDYDFKIGAPVLAAEGKVGQLKYVVVDPHTEVVTHLVVERGLLVRHDIVVPVGWVEAAGIRRHGGVHRVRGGARDHSSQGVLSGLAIIPHPACAARRS